VVDLENIGYLPNTPQTHKMYIKAGWLSVCHTANMYNMNIKKTRIQKQKKS